jgi:hypothetical protein
VLFRSNPNNPSHTIPQYPSFRRNNDGSFSKLHGEFEDYKKDYWQERAKQLAEKNH